MPLAPGSARGRRPSHPSALAACSAVVGGGFSQVAGRAGGRRCGGGGEILRVLAPGRLSSVPRAAGGTLRMPTDADGRGGGGRCGTVTVRRAAAIASAAACLTASCLSAWCFASSSADGSSSAATSSSSSAPGSEASWLAAAGVKLFSDSSRLAGCASSCWLSCCRFARSASFSRAASACRACQEPDAEVSSVKE